MCVCPLLVCAQGVSLVAAPPCKITRAGPLLWPLSIGHVGPDPTKLPTLLGLQSRVGDNPLKFQVVCPQNGTPVLKRSTTLTPTSRSAGAVAQVRPRISLALTNNIKRSCTSFFFGRVVGALPYLYIGPLAVGRRPAVRGACRTSFFKFFFRGSVLQIWALPPLDGFL